MRKALYSLALGLALGLVLLIFSSSASAAVSDEDVLSAFNGLVVQEQINQTNKPQYSGNAGTFEVVDPASGNLTWKSTQIQLPGREGLDLNIGVMYQLNDAFFYMRHKKTDGSLKKYNYLISRYDLGAGWSFQFPSLQKQDSYLYYHQGNGAVYKVDFVTMESYNFSHLVGYQGKDLHLEKDTGTFTNGQEASKYYLEYDDGKREYFADDGRLLGIVDRFGNQIIFKHINLTMYDGQTYKVISSITDTIGRTISFEYKDGTADTTDIILTVKDPDGNITQKLQYRRMLWNITFNNKADGTAPVLGSITILDKNGNNVRSMSFGYDDIATKFNFNSKKDSASAISNDYFPLKDVITETIETHYAYGIRSRNLGTSGFGQEMAVTSRYEKLINKGTIYNKIDYSYTNDYTGYPTYLSASEMTSGYSFSSTSTVSSSSLTNGLATTTEFNGYQQEHIITTKASNGEKKVVTNLKFSSTYPYKPTETKIETYRSESDTSPDRVYVNKSYNDWGGIAQETLPYTDSTTKNAYTIRFAYESTHHFLSSKTWFQEVSGTPISESYTYYNDGRLKSYTDANAVVTSYCYEAVNTSGATTTNCSNASTVLTGSVSKVKASKDLGNGQTSIAETYYGAATKYAYPSATKSYFTTTNSSGNRITQTVQKTMTYDLGSGLLKTEADSNGNTTTYTYDVLGRTTSITYPSFTNLSGTKYNVSDLYTYENTLIPSTADSENANTSALKVTSQRKYVRTSDNSSAILSSQVEYYDGLGSLRYAMATNNGTTQVTQYHMDDLNRAVYMIDPMGNTTTAAYDAWGNQKEAADVYGNLYVTEYDPKARKVTQYLVASANVTAYRANTAIASLKSNYLEQTYDQLGHLISNKVYKDWPAQTQPVTETYTYDVVGNLKSYTDPNGNINEDKVTTGYNYDAMNRLISVTDAMGQITKYTYDANGQLTGTTIQAGEEGTPQSLKSKTYNEAGLLASKLDTASKAETYAYNNLGLLQQSKDRKATVFTYQYDEQQRNTMQTATGSSGGTQQNKTIIGSNGILYDTYETYKNSSKTGSMTTGIDYLKRVTSFSLQNGSSTYTSYLGLTYDKNSRITMTNTGAASPGGFYVQYKYVQHRLNKVQVNGSATADDTAASNVTYTYYPNGQVKTVTYPTLTTGSTLTTTYVYDALNRVSTVTNAKGTTTLSKYTYTYDNNGNVISLVEAVTGQTAKTSSYTYDKLNRLKGITRSDGSKASYTYDLQGNRQTLYDSATTAFDLNATSYVYDLFNTLTSATKGSTTAAFEYTPDGMRYKKTIGSVVTQYRFNQNGEVIAEVNGSNATTANYVRGDRLLVKKDVSTGKDYYYLYNGHGDVVQMVDTSGNVVNSYSYDEWGNLTRQTEQVPNIFKYAGEVYDSETGLYYLRARYYDPSIGRFINEDTYEGQIDNPLSLNLYTYVENNPLIYSDPSGMCGIRSWGDAGDCFVKAGKAVKTAAVATYNFFIGDDLNTLLDPNSSQQEKDMAAKMLALNFIPGEGQAAKVGVKVAEKQALKIAEEQMAKQILKESDQFINLYRAVGADEFYQVMESGSFKVSPMGFDGKQFGLNFDDTLKFAEKYKDIAAIVEVKVSKTELDKIADYTHVDPFIFKNGTLTIHLEHLDDFNKIIQAINHKY
ncbi:RHS repeat domain-containing protein [Cohnella thermotolerans]|uniref:RHS repeat domain-containing protein n=1 Tax=Cohnella thermotolerans TaxID=329858 RepID=UPI0003FE124F|nr:RHS repeat-associated core domain-containing protein [Cohnella thermotolerans]